MNVYTIKATPLVKRIQMDFEDAQDFNKIRGSHLIEANDQEEALDEFHAEVPISCLDDWSIDVVASN